MIAEPSIVECVFDVARVSVFAPIVRSTQLLVVQQLRADHVDSNL